MSTSDNLFSLAKVSSRAQLLLRTSRACGQIILSVYATLTFPSDAGDGSGGRQDNEMTRSDEMKYILSI